MNKTTRYLIALLLVAVSLSGITACAGDPLTEIYTENIYPGTPGTYSVGSENYSYGEGWFDLLYADNLTVTETSIFSEGWFDVLYAENLTVTGNLTVVAGYFDGLYLGGDTLIIFGDIFDAKGDLVTATGDDTPVRLPVGADTFVLSANSTTVTGLEWVAISNGGVGGLYGINVEQLTGDKTLTPGTDEIYQYLDPDGDRNITLVTVGATAGDRFFIRNTGTKTTNEWLSIKEGITTLQTLYPGAVISYIYDGTHWVGEDTLSSSWYDENYQNFAIGFAAKGYNYGIGLGSAAAGHQYGVAIGNSSIGQEYGVGIGYCADGRQRGAAVGYRSMAQVRNLALGYYAKADAKRYSIALGYYARCYRYGETSVNIDGNATQKNNVVQGRWSKTTTDATPVELFCGAYGTSRFTIRPISALAFKMTIVARDNVANEVAMYTVEDGLIKRDAAGNTTMVNCTVTTVHEDDAGWDVAVTADDANEALIITVTGDADNPVQWAVRMDGVETHF